MFRGHAYGRLGSPLRVVGGGAYVPCMYKLNDNTPYNTWLVTNTTAQYAQCNITVLAVRMQHAEIYSYFVPIFDGDMDTRTHGHSLNPSWSGVTRGYLPVKIYGVAVILF